MYTALRGVAGLAAEGRDEAPAEVLAALSDDLNTPLALAHMHELAGALNKAGSEAERARAKGALLAAGDLMGLLRHEPEGWFRWQPAGAAGTLDEAGIERLIQARADARKGRDFAEADRLRKHLADNGVLLEDGPRGTTWKRV